MQLVYFQTDVANFGDDLNRDIWPALAPRLFAREEPGRDFTGIGTILGRPSVRGPRIEVFSTGAGNDSLSHWAGREVVYHCVRGPVTARLCGLDTGSWVTDGALLTPQVPGFPDRAVGGGGIAVIPHFETAAHGDWQKVCQLAGMRYVDPRRPTRDVIDDIVRADLVLTESLHGAILADTYGVGWQVFATSRNFGVSKWIDWTASLDLRLRITIVPPPSPGLLLHTGRRSEPFGTTVEFGLEDAFGEFGNRVDADRVRPIRNLARSALLRFSPLQGLLGFSPARTAEALTALAARQSAQCSSAATRSRLSGELLTRLERLHASYSE
jgi:succinoglycan biosynthesis protein ExoV